MSHGEGQGGREYVEHLVWRQVKGRCLVPCLIMHCEGKRKLVKEKVRSSVKLDELAGRVHGTTKQT